MTEFTPTLALVTGASSGIGYRLAQVLAEDGVDLILVARREEILRELAEGLSGKCKVTCFPCDLSCDRDRHRLCELIDERVPDLIVNNAGFGLYGDVLSHDSDAHKKVLRVNAEAVIDLSYASALALKNAKKQGVILNVASVAGLLPMSCFTSYAAAKAFVISWSRAFDTELSEEGIRILVTCPGKVSTNFAKVAAKGQSYDIVEYGSMSVDYAVAQIYKQIRCRKPFYVFDWRYCMISFFSSLLPMKYVQKIIKKYVSVRRH